VHDADGPVETRLLQGNDDDPPVLDIGLEYAVRQNTEAGT
jgi:hypothetical protein